MQIVPDGLALMLTLAVKAGVTEAMMELDVAGLPETHTALDIITHFTVSVFANEVVEKVLAVPAFILFFFHW